MTSYQSVSLNAGIRQRHTKSIWCGWVRWQNGTFKNLRTITEQPTCCADAVPGIAFYKPRSGLHFTRNLKTIFKIYPKFPLHGRIGN
ncbi:MAG: hypothetical protein AAF630_03350 [Cyanobacteria bacterium P01_C01_bin.38]